MNISEYINKSKKEKAVMLDTLRNNITKIALTYVIPNVLNFDNVMRDLDSVYADMPQIPSGSYTANNDLVNMLSNISDTVSVKDDSICTDITSYSTSELSDIINNSIRQSGENEKVSFEHVLTACNEKSGGDNRTLINSIISACYKLYNRLLYIIDLMMSTRIPSFKLLRISIIPLINRLKSLFVYLGKYTKILDMLVDNITNTVLSYLSYFINFKRGHQARLDDTTDYLSTKLCGVYPFSNNKNEENTTPNTEIFNIDNIRNMRCDSAYDIVKYPSFERIQSELDCSGQLEPPDTSIPNSNFESAGEIACTKGILLGDIHFNIGDSIKFGASYGESKWVSPINGIVYKQTDTKTYISDITDGDNSFENVISDISTVYDKERKIFEFVCANYHLSILPVMYYNSQVNSIGFIKTKTQKLYKDLCNECDNHHREYETNIKNISGADNVEKHATSETLDTIYESIKNEKNILLNRIKSSVSNHISKCRNSTYEILELDMLEFYISTLLPLSYHNSDINEIAGFKAIVLNIIKRRISSTNKIVLIDAINKRGKDYNIHYRDLLSTFNQNKTFDQVKSDIIKTGIGDTSADIILELLRISVETKGDTNISLKMQLKTDVEDINNYWTSLLRCYNNLDATSLLSNIDNLANVDYNYNMITEDGESYRVYNVNTQADVCDSETYDIESEMSHKTKYSLDNIKYWIKYMSMATLTGCVPIYYTTGLIILGAPIPLPVIYIPIKAIKTKWGVIVIGLGVCGIAISPMVYYVNLSNNATSIIPNLAAISIEASIKALKATNHKLENNTVNVYLDSVSSTTNVSIESQKQLLDNLEADYKNLKANEPKVPKFVSSDGKIINIPKLPTVDNVKIKYDKKTKTYESNIGKIVDSINSNKQKCMNTLNSDISIRFDEYCVEYTEYITALAEAKVKVITANDVIGELCIHKTKIDKCKVKAINETIDNTHGAYASQIKTNTDKISELTKQLESLQLSNPLALLSPNSVNFGPSIKNFNLVTQIDDDVHNHFNLPKLSDVSDILLKPSTHFLSSPSVELLTSVMGNISNISTSLIVKDVLPKYEKLTPLNLQFMLFLSKSFCVKGGKHFGLMGYPQ